MGRSAGAGRGVDVRARIMAAGLGAMSWTGLEYGLHRFAMHEMRGRGLASREHLRHHADVTYFSPASKKLLSASATTAAVFPLARLLAGRTQAEAFTVGMVSAYFGYEVAHRRTHTHPPRGRYGRWARRNHLHHHFGAPMRNFGVTTPVWDRLAGTYDEPGVITVPRRMAPVWLVDQNGETRPEYRGDYLVRGQAVAAADLDQLDHDDAFDNRPPSV